MLFSLSCRDEIIPEKDSQKETPKVKLSNTEIKKEFGAALAKVLKVAGRKMNYVISFIRNTLNAKYSGIQIKE